MSTALNNAGHNCNLVTQAESLVMAKERLVEQYGEIRYTIGTGCSGGSLTQQQVANAYPGIYQGILPQCSFPDAWSTGQQFADYHLLRRYFEDPSQVGAGRRLGPGCRSRAVEGHPNHVNSIVFDTVYWTVARRARRRLRRASRPSEQLQRRDQPRRRALHARRLHDQRPRPAAAERLEPQPSRQVGHGFAGLPLDNVGVQYGLEALKKGQITPAQFVDLNAKIGGVDIDINPTAERIQADQPALAQRLPQRRRSTAPTTSTRSRSSTCAGPTRAPSTTPTARGRSARGSSASTALHANQVIWFGAVPLIGDPNYATEGLLAMDRWLAAVEADKRDGLARAEDRPTTARATSRTAARRSPGVEQVVAARRRHGLRARAGPDALRHAAHGRRRGRRDRHEQVPAQAAAAQRLLPDRVHRRPVGAAPAGVPDRRLRLDAARASTSATRSRGRPTRTRAAA